MPTPMSYRKKPVVIQAMWWDGTRAEAGSFIEWMNADDIDGLATSWYREANETVDREKPAIMIATLEGVMTCSPGDWVIKGINGEFYPCKPDIFQATYDVV